MIANSSSRDINFEHGLDYSSNLYVVAATTYGLTSAYGSVTPSEVSANIVYSN
jgi:hypothetical protein